MISPKHINFNDSVQALLSYEKARFAPYDLDEAEAEPVVIESNETFDLLEVKLKLANGEEVIRHVKAYKNGETAIVDPEPEPEVEPEPVLTKVTVTGASTVTAGEELALGYTLEPVGYVAKSVQWETNNGIIDENGTLLAETEGEAQVTVTIDGVKSAVKTITVAKPVVAVTDFNIDAPESVNSGETAQLSYTVTPEGATVETAVWSVENGEITQDGLFSTESGFGGSVTVNLTINGIKKSATINVVGL